MGKSMSESKKQSKNTVKGRNGGTLNPSKKGDPSPNPNGRPKGSRNRSTVIREFLEATMTEKNPITGKTEKLSVEQLMALSMIKQVLSKGNVHAWNSIKDDAYGKAKESVELSGDIGVDLTEKLSKEELKSRLDKLGLSDKIFDK
jgi:hypothetical protein